MTSLEKLTTWFREQVGTKESGENNVIYNTRFYGHEVQGPSYPWCMAFIWDGFHQCGLSKLFLDGGKSAYCPYVVNWAKEHGRWVMGDYRAGDILFYDWDSDGQADHVGFCIGSSNGRLDSIEGNITDAVCVTHRVPGSVLGAYRPAYSTSDGKKDERTGLPLLKRGDVSGAVLSVQVLLIHKWSVSCGPDGADGDFGPNTERAVKEFQQGHGLDQDGEVGPATWAALIR